jgi:uncharacterized protein (DUF58 family)
MSWGKPSKVRLGAQLAGALAFIALQNGDRVSLATCHDDGIGQRLDGLRAEGAAWTAWRLLEQVTCEGATDLSGALAACARRMRGSGLSVVVSDLFSPTGYQQGIDALLARRQDVVLIHVLAPDEMEPAADLIGEWRLVDTEPVSAVEASITPGVLRAYRRLLQTFTKEAADFCRRRGITYLQLRSDTPVTEVVLRTFRSIGVVV